MSIIELKNKYINNDIEKHDFIDQMFEQHKCLFNYVNDIKNTDIKEIHITDSGCVFTTRQCEIKFFCDHLDKRIAPIEILNFYTYEKTETDLLLSLMQDNFTFFDIGANIGWYSCNVAKKFVNVRIFSFEPMPHTFMNLERNVKINKLNNVHLNNIGFSNCNDNLDFYYDKENSGCTSMQQTAQQRIEKITATVVKLDDFMLENNIQALDFIKCDVEGAELLVYQGGECSIKQYLPIVFTEMLRKWSDKFDYHPNKIISMFNQWGYCCYAITTAGCELITYMNDDTSATNFIFLHKKKHLQQISKL